MREMVELGVWIEAWSSKLGARSSVCGSELGARCVENSLESFVCVECM